MTTAFEEYSSDSDSISIALCTYNGSAYLKDQLASIAAQTHKPSELIVCDDGSQDGTMAILKEFAGKAGFPVRIHRNEQNLGSTRNFEQAIRQCRGKFIALSDQDDWWSPTKLLILLKTLQQHSAGGVFCDGALMDENSKPVHGSLWKEARFSKAASILMTGSREHAVSELLKRNVVTGATLMFRSELREILMPFPAEWVHDGWMAWMIVMHSRLVAVPEPLIRYRVHGIQQVGVPGSPAARVRRARQMGVEDNRRVDRQFGVLYGYAQAHGYCCGPGLQNSIQAKRRSAQFRAELPGNHIIRWVRMAARFSDYRLYAQGWRSMLKDALV